MRLLFDENLSVKVVHQILDLFPGSSHVKHFKLINTPDSEIWFFAQREGFAIVTKDSDFHQMSLLNGFPPKVIHLAIGNRSSKDIIEVIRKNKSYINEFLNDKESSLLIFEADA